MAKDKEAEIKKTENDIEKVRNILRNIKGEYRYLEVEIDGQKIQVPWRPLTKNEVEIVNQHWMTIKRGGSTKFHHTDRDFWAVVQGCREPDYDNWGHEKPVLPKAEWEYIAGRNFAVINLLGTEILEASGMGVRTEEEEPEGDFF